MAKKLSRGERLKRIHDKKVVLLTRQLKKLMGDTKPSEPLPAYRTETVKRQPDSW